jgi:ATP-binding cassette subfamily F protein uup
LLGELEPDTGSIRRGANVQTAYYDQQREQLDPERTVFDTVGEGNDTVTVNGRTQHVHGYLRDFLFSAERANSPVKALSGGERNRLLLARLLTKAANVLVLDEPTNDLDIETLELLEAFLVGWPGTLLLVSHDRRFIDNVVTSTLVFEGDGRVTEYVGGYDDWLRQRTNPEEAPSPPSREAAAPSPAAPVRRKLSYHEQREFGELPAKIHALEDEQLQLQARIASPDFYREAAHVITQTLARADEVQDELLAAMERWDELDSRATIKGS